MNNTFVLASNNAHKLREFREIFATIGFTVLSLKEAGVAVDPDENGVTFAENAMIKAQAVYDICKLPTVADDSGLCV
ncbi:MAG: non-canonical purine NTP pyrophosphatase, partial [Clostridia bacterium]|nr:non-canonical purine NTP pyrophosphatase [Clostridia bacterium]